MPVHSDIRYLPFSQDKVFEIILDVAQYPNFLPWCVAARLYNQQENRFDADLIIGFKMFKERFTSRVSYERSSKIHVEYIKGPLKYLHNHWTLTPHEGGTKLEFHVDFAFKNPIFQKLVGHLFEEAVFKMVMAFETRVEQQLGQKACDNSPL